MENTPVLIVGAGPSGLALGLSLAKHNVKVRSYHMSPETLLMSIIVRHLGERNTDNT